MKLTKKLPILGASLAALGVAAFATFQQAQGGNPAGATTPATQTPVRLMFAQPFFLDQAYQYAWLKDGPSVSAGWLIAVATDPAVAAVTDTHDELLFAGATPVERINEGSLSGVVIGIVPSAVQADGTLAVDLATTPLYWAKPEILPEAMTAADAQRTLETAVKAGAVAQGQSVAQRAQEANGGPVFETTAGMLYRYSADLIERFSPQEADLISGLRAPLVNK
jgi:hypothetical protein